MSHDNEAGSTDKPRRALSHAWLRVLATLLLAAVAAGLCLMLHTPLPWMIGPLIATSLVSMAGLPTQSLAPLRNAGQWTIGCALGLYFTPQVVAVVASLWWAIALNIAWALTIGLICSLWLHRVHAAPGRFHVAGITRVTTFFAAPTGGAVEMTQMAERHGGQEELVASAHSLRVMLVTVTVPFALQAFGLDSTDAVFPAMRAVDAGGLAMLAGLTGFGGVVMVLLRRTNPWFIGALCVSLLLTANGISLSALPVFLINAAQLVVAISLGVRFRKSFVRLAPPWLTSVAFSTLVMIALSAGFACALAPLAGLHWATVLLGTTPGGVAEMSITAKALKLGVPIVTAFHVTRLAAVLLLTGPLYRCLYGIRNSD